MSAEFAEYQSFYNLWSEAERDVLASVATELEHQRRRAGDWDNANTPSVEAEVLILEELLSDARKSWMNARGSEACLDIGRKIAAVAVRCLANHGCPPRVLQ